ncbi:nicotinate-nucleotide diphosphorylase (carboxylating) [Metarhizium acridum]|nr:nicotinate-nucleotide diphosphorylase (carboxylating) [Metarhizium acridum]
MDLSAMIMLKDNHVWSRGSITDAVKAARAVGGFSVKVEVEGAERAGGRRGHCRGRRRRHAGQLHRRRGPGRGEGLEGALGGEELPVGGFGGA